MTDSAAVTRWPAYEDLLEGHITTFTGRQIDPLTMTPEQVDIRDIAHALAHSNRWLGHTRRPFSVAEHCLIGAKLLLQQTNDPALALEFLLHDATEAYLPDLPRPLKQKPEFGFYRSVEKRIWYCIGVAFELGSTLSAPVIKMDALMAKSEYNSLMIGNVPPGCSSLSPYRVESPLEPKFLATFYELMFERTKRNRAEVAA